MTPSTTRHWSVNAEEGLDGLKLRTDIPLPPLTQIQRLARIAAVSLNYRDVAIPAGKYPGYYKETFISCSDRAGAVVAIGDAVRMHAVGDRICTLFNQAHQAGPFTKAMSRSMPGSALDGPLSEYDIFEGAGLVVAPNSLDLIEAATIPCVGVTVWNALFGLGGRAVVRGTGGVSLFAIAFATAIGASVISTTSSEAKVEALKEMGVQHVINYRDDASRGETVRRIADGEGVHMVVDIVGENTVRQSLLAVRPEGVVSLAGFLSGLEKPQNAVGFAECFDALAIMRSVEVGSRKQFVEMNALIDEEKIKPAVGKRSYGFEQVKEAYHHQAYASSSPHRRAPRLLNGRTTPPPTRPSRTCLHRIRKSVIVADFLFASSWGNASAAVASTDSPSRSVTPGPRPSPSKTRSAFPLPNRLVKALSSSSIKDKADQQRRDLPGGTSSTGANGYTEASASDDKSGMAAAVARPVQRTSIMMDTRTPSPPVRRPEDGDADGVPDIEVTPSKNEGLNAEIQMLSTKLVNAINYNTNLDDTLQATRSELEQARQELARVRAEKRSLDDAITQGVLLKKSEVDKTMASLRAEMAQARAEREKAEKAKKQTEGELENLTSALFEEANTMVAAARKDTEAVEKRNSQLRSQLQDTEVLLASQQEQLQDLKSTMEKLERSDAQRDSSIPSTPVTGPGGGFDSMIPASPAGAGAPEVQPSHPLHFSSMLAPILRNDVAAFQDFSELIVSARKAQPHSRNVSGNYSSTNFASGSSSATAMTSSPNLPGAFSFGGGSNSANSSPSSSGFNNPYPYVNPPLKESKFWKRILVEDIEPTLRLDLAPGLSFLSRRTVNSSLLNGTLVVEPFQQQNYKFYAPVFACALCGESRKTEPYIRRYRFRTSEADDAQRYPLCEYCLGRVRTSCDFVGFLRMVRDGHWRCEGEAEEKSAWEEAVKLRERMFWARLGGGVVPRGHLPTATAAAQKTSLESVPEKASDMVGASKQPKEAGVEADATPSETPEAGAGDAESEGIGRALVNMSSRAASSAMPELKPQASDQHVQEPSSSQEEQDPASAQLHREEESAQVDTARATDTKTADLATPPAEASLERFATPAGSRPSAPPVQRPLSGTPSPTKSRPSSPFKADAEAKRNSIASSPIVSRPSSPVKASLDEKRLSSPARGGGRSASPFKRPISPSKADERPSNRTTSPAKAGGEEKKRSLSRTGRSELRPAESATPERRPSSQAQDGSSVLARVRAMEGKN